MNNEELIKRNEVILDKINTDNFLDKYYFKVYDKFQEEYTINLLKTQKSYLEKYKKDYLLYFAHKKTTDGLWTLWGSCLMFCFIALIMCLGSGITDASFLSLKNILIILNDGFLFPTLLFLKLIPSFRGKRVYKSYIDNINTKLEIIKNDRLEKGLIVDKEEVNKDKKINDSFVKMIKDTITKIKSLEYAGQKNDLLKIKEIAEEYFTIIRKEIELDDVVNLTTNEDIINLQKRLIEIENDAIAKAKIESDESALESEFEPLTTLDRRSVELDTDFKESYNGDVPAILKRKLNLYDD